MSGAVKSTQKTWHLELQASKDLQYLKSGKLMYFRNVLCHLYVLCLCICLKAPLLLYAYQIPTCKVFKALVLFYSHSSTAFSHSSALFSHLSWNLSKQLSTKCTQDQENTKYTVISFKCLQSFTGISKITENYKLGIHNLKLQYT